MESAEAVRQQFSSPHCHIVIGLYLTSGRSTSAVGFAASLRRRCPGEWRRMTSAHGIGYAIVPNLDLTVNGLSAHREHGKSDPPLQRVPPPRVGSSTPKVFIFPQQIIIPDFITIHDVYSMQVCTVNVKYSTHGAYNWVWINIHNSTSTGTQNVLKVSSLKILSFEYISTTCIY